MRQPIIDSEDPELEFNPYDACCLRYKGEFFTGTVIYTDTDPVSFTEYKDGEFDGRDITYHENGTLLEDCICENGKYISGKEWYENGQLRFDSAYNNVIWDVDGLLIRKDWIYFYKNGNPKTKKDELGNYYLSPDGDVAIFNSILSEESSPCKSHTIFHDKVIIKFLSDLFENKYSRYEDNRDSTMELDRQIKHYIICLYLGGYKAKAISVAEQIVKDSNMRENENGSSKSGESILRHNYTCLIKHLEDDRIVEVFPYHTDKCVEIKFD
ncbi:hypothetical protein [Pedobacter sp.]|uniref:toxin-antitoxin system YwqK family antitoxin n=1 Tax=Pedobacter sp. TaxID=1411316 RepID=UPI0031D0619F